MNHLNHHKIFKLTDLICSPIWLLAWGLGLMTLLSVLGLVMVSGWFITMSGMMGMLALSDSFNYLVPSALIRTFALGRTLSRYADLMVSHNAVFELLKNLRVRFFNHFSQLSPSERLRIGSSLAQYRLVQDIDTLDEFPLRVVSPILVVAVGAVFLAILCVVLVGAFVPALLILATLVVYALFPQKCLANRLGESVQQRQVMLLDRLPVMTQLLTWGRWQDTTRALSMLDNEHMGIHQRVQRNKRLGVLLTQWLVVVAGFWVLWTGIAQVQTGADVAVLLALVLGILGFLEIAAGLYAEPLAHGKSVLAQQRINELLSVRATSKTQRFPDNFSIKINELSAKQPSAVFGIKDINTTINQGNALVIYGVSGGGKSTLLSVLAQEIKAQAGTITVESQQGSYDWQQIDLGDDVGFLGQTVDIFNHSLKQNLLLGHQNASDEMLWQVLDWVGLAEWAQAQPDKLNTALGENGQAISGGQARRIALARLLLSPKKVLLLDEPFAGLDQDNRQRLWQVLKQRQRNAHLIVVSHHEDIIDDNSITRLKIGNPSVI